MCTACTWVVWPVLAFSLPFSRTTRSGMCPWIHRTWQFSMGIVSGMKSKHVKTLLYSSSQALEQLANTLSLYSRIILSTELLQTTQHKPGTSHYIRHSVSNCIQIVFDLLHSSTFPCGASRFCHSFQRCSSFSQRRTSVKWFNFQPAESKEPWTWIQIDPKSKQNKDERVWEW